MRKWTLLGAVAAIGLGASLVTAGSMMVTSVDSLVKANPRGDKPIKWTEAAKNDYVRLMVGEVKDWGYHSHGNETHIVVVMKGRGTAMIDGEHRDLKPGDVLTLPAGSKHAISQKGKEQLVILATWSASFDPSKDTMKHDMDHAGHDMQHGQHGHAVQPASATTTKK